jgi:hypothetical protein
LHAPPFRRAPDPPPSPQGFLIDVDHVLDYLAFERQRDLRPAAFLRYYLAGQTRVVVLLLHSYEVLAALALAAWWTNLEGLWGYVLGAAALHLPLDIVFNGKVAGRNMVPFYSVIYRARAGFRTSRLIDGGRIGTPDPRFWSAFFVGSVARDSSLALHHGADDPGRELFLSDAA